MAPTTLNTNPAEFTEVKGWLKGATTVIAGNSLADINEYLYNHSWTIMGIPNSRIKKQILLNNFLKKVEANIKSYMEEDNTTFSSSPAPREGSPQLEQFSSDEEDNSELPDSQENSKDTDMEEANSPNPLASPILLSQGHYKQPSLSPSPPPQEIPCGQPQTEQDEWLNVMPVAEKLRLAAKAMRIREATKEIFKLSKVDKPFAFIDLETTGLDTYSDRIIEICIIRYNPTNGEKREWTQRINPEFQITPGAMEKTGINNAMLADMPTLSTVWPDICGRLAHSYVVGFNNHFFDWRLLRAESVRHGLDMPHIYGSIDLQVIFWQNNPQNLGACYLKYTGKEMHANDAHSALGDTQACIEILAAFLKQGLVPNVMPNFQQWAMDTGAKASGQKQIIINHGTYLI